MSFTLRKLEMLEQSMIHKAEEAKITGVTAAIDHDFKNKITKLMDKIRVH